MQGYQQENERLYKELKQIQAKAKSTEGRMFAENQKLGMKCAISKVFIILFYRLMLRDGP